MESFKLTWQMKIALKNSKFYLKGQKTRFMMEALGLSEWGYLICTLISLLPSALKTEYTIQILMRLQVPSALMLLIKRGLLCMTWSIFLKFFFLSCFCIPIQPIHWTLKLLRCSWIMKKSIKQKSETMYKNTLRKN